MKTLFRIVGAVCVVASLGACAAPQSASRAAIPSDAMVGTIRPDLRVESFTVSVPRTLEVNERNTYYPIGDIVWRGDPLGDRYAQVEAIFETALRNAAPNVQGTRPVRVDVQVTRFQALSEKARYTVGGIHDISFLIRLVDVQTGAQLGETQHVDADLEALSGRGATAADARGETQKARIQTHLARVFVEQLTSPNGYRNPQLGLLQSINAIR